MVQKCTYVLLKRNAIQKNACINSMWQRPFNDKNSFSLVFPSLCSSHQNSFPFFFLVAEKSRNVSIIFSTRDWWSPALGGVGGNIWRYSTATLSGARLSYSFGRPGQPGEAPQEFKWNDANSGVHSNRPNGFGWYYSPFTRLDG